MATPVDPYSAPDPYAPRELPAGADPVAANLDSVTPIAPPLSSVPTTKAVLSAGWVTGITAGIVCVLLRALGGLFGADFLIPAPGSTDLIPVPWFMIFILPIVCGVLGSLVAAIFLGVKGCQRWVFWLGTGLMLVSLAPPLLQPDPVTWPTRIWLAVMRVVTWGITVPQIARVVGDSDPRVTAGYRDATPL